MRALDCFSILIAALLVFWFFYLRSDAFLYRKSKRPYRDIANKAISERNHKIEEHYNQEKMIAAITNLVGECARSGETETEVVDSLIYEGQEYNIKTMRGQLTKESIQLLRREYGIIAIFTTVRNIQQTKEWALCLRW